jgi:hypothetical protein
LVAEAGELATKAGDIAGCKCRADIGPVPVETANTADPTTDPRPEIIPPPLTPQKRVQNGVGSSRQAPCPCVRRSFRPDTKPSCIARRLVAMKNGKAFPKLVMPAVQHNSKHIRKSFS